MSGVKFSGLMTQHTYHHPRGAPLEQEYEVDMSEEASEEHEVKFSKSASKGDQLVSAFSKKKPIERRIPLKQRSFSLVPERLSGIKSSPAVGVHKHLLGCEYFLQGLLVVLMVLTLPFSLFLCLRVVPQYQRAVVFRLGRLVCHEAAGPGLVIVMPCIDVIKRVDLRTFTFDVPTQEVLTKDSVTVAVDAVVYYRIFDPVMSVVNIEDANRSTRLLAATTLRNVLGTVDLSQLLTDRQEIAAMMQETLDTATDTWGVKVERVEVKDVRLPQMLQRAMAAEAEATREAKAKIIAAEGEHQAAKPLTQAALQISECTIALQLRYLQTLSSISAEKNSTIIFPVPVDMFRNSQSLCPSTSQFLTNNNFNNIEAPVLPPRQTYRSSSYIIDRKELPVIPTAPSEPDMTV